MQYNLKLPDSTFSINLVYFPETRGLEGIKGRGLGPGRGRERERDKGDAAVVRGKEGGKEE